MLLGSYLKGDVMTVPKEMKWYQKIAKAVSQFLPFKPLIGLALTLEN